jgi:hypothetical protein
MAFGNRRRFLLAAGLGLSTVIGCGPTIENEANPIGPPPDPSTFRKESGKESVDRVKSETKELRQGKERTKKPRRFGPG